MTPHPALAVVPFAFFTPLPYAPATQPHESMPTENLPAVASPAAVPSVVGRYADDLKAVGEIGDWIHKSGMFGVKSPGGGAMVAMEMIARGMRPLQFIERFHLIEGKPSMKADAMRTVFKHSGGAYEIEQFDADGSRVAWEWEERGRPRRVVTSFDTVDAKRAGKLPAKSDSNWACYPAEMMLARNTTKFMRAYRPELLEGAYDPDELGKERDDAEPVEYIKSEPAERTPEPDDEAAGFDPVKLDAELAAATAGAAEAETDDQPAEATKSTPLPDDPPELVDVTAEALIEGADEPAEPKADPPTLGKLAELLKSHGVTPTECKEKLVARFNVESIRDLPQSTAERLLDEWRTALADKAAAG